MKALQIDMEQGPVTREILMKEKKECEAFHYALKKDEELWRPKSRSLQLLVGDIDSKLFYNQAKYLTWKNNFREITVRGTKINDFLLIQDEEIEHFLELYNKVGPMSAY